MDFEIKQKLLYLLRFTDCDIQNTVCSVLEDSESDPHFSAVTTANMIKCYIDVMTYLDEKPPFKSVEEYFEQKGFSEKEYDSFVQSIKKEKEYYIGKIY